MDTVRFHRPPAWTLCLAAAWAGGLVPGARAAGWRRPAAPERPPLEVVALELAAQDVPLYSEWLGTTYGSVDAQIRPKVQGYLLEQAYTNGTLVGQGQLLFRIDPRQFQAALSQAEADVRRAEAALKESELDVARYTPLVQEGAISRQEYDQSVQQAEANRAAVDAARAAREQARLNRAWTEVVSPIAGLAGINATQIGDLVGEPTVLTTVSQVDPIRVQFPLSEREYLYVARHQEPAPGAAATNPVALILADGSVYPEPGVLIGVDRQVDVRTGTLTVQAAFPNPARLLRPGQYAKVRMLTRVARGALKVPQRAVMDVQGKALVAVVDGAGQVRFRPVGLGPAVGPDRLVAQGLSPGERIVVEGLQKVRDGMTVVVRPPAAPAPAR